MAIEYGILKNWDDVLEKLPTEQSDIYFSSAYVFLYENEQDKAECFIYKNGSQVYLFPYLKRENHLCNESFFDFETAYGYGGPVASSIDPDFIAAAESVLFDTCRRNGFVAGFMRSSPWLDNQKVIADVSRLTLDRKTVLMDLRPTEEEIWSEQIHSKHRNVIRKAEREGLTFEVDAAFEHIGAFVEMYSSTMQRLNADDFYFFSEDYFTRFETSMAGNAFLGLVRFEDKIISAALFMHQGIYGHYHLSGSLPEFRRLAPNNLLIYKAALHLKTLGVRFFHLGGGSDSSPENTLFKFKRRFSPICRDFYIGKFIFDSELYAEICAQWERDNPQKRVEFDHLLLKYRY